MPQIVTPFTSYVFAQEEELAAKIFSTLQIQNLQNFRAQAAMDLIQDQYDETRDKAFHNRRAYLQGQVDLINQLMSEHDVMLSARQEAE